MNIYFIIIILSIVGEYLISSVSRYLNLKALTTRLPEEFTGFYDEEKYRKSQEYTRESIRFGWITATVDLVIILLMILLGGFNLVDNYVRNRVEHSILQGLVFYGILFLLHDLISLPFSLYHTFNLEKRYGFNKTTPGLFITDKLKSYLLMLIFGSIIGGALLYLFESLGNIAWLAAWGIMTLVTAVMPVIYTRFIAPLFNKFTPLEDGELKDRMMELSRSVQFPLREVYLMDGSRRSSHSNAYFTGFGKNKRIVLYDTLLKNHSADELLAIIAHEIGHYKKKHILKGMIFSILHMGLLFYLISLFLNNPGLFAAFRMEHLSVYASLLFFGLLYTPVEMLLSVVMNVVSRKQEFEADGFSVETTGLSEALISGLKNLTVANLGNLTPHPFTVFMQYSHPPVLERIRAIRNPTRESSGGVLKPETR